LKVERKGKEEKKYQVNNRAKNRKYGIKKKSDVELT